MVVYILSIDVRTKFDEHLDRFNIAIEGRKMEWSSPHAVYSECKIRVAIEKDLKTLHPQRSSEMSSRVAIHSIVWYTRVGIER
jgi:hypothetical protein